MVFQFEHVQLDQGASKWDVHPLQLRDLKASFGRWQDGLADVGWNSLYWNNHDQPRVVSRFGDDGEHRVRGEDARHGAAPASRDAVRLPGRGARDDERAVHLIDEFRDIESLNHYAEAVAEARCPRVCVAAQMGRDNARTPMQWDASRTPGSRPETPWLGGQPEPRRRSTPRPRSPTRIRSSTTTGG